MSPAISPSVSPGILLLRRMALIVPVIVITLIGINMGWTMIGGLEGALSSPLDLLAFTVFSVLFALLSFTSWAMSLGLILWISGRRKVPLEKEALAIPVEQLLPSIKTRTAILIPAYHEDPVEVFARVRVMQNALAALQPIDMESDVDIFVLSDSQNPDAVAAEAVEYKKCLATLTNHGPKVYYRRRENNTEYKVGNIKDFCTRWGAGYEHMLILDADSLMSGETIRRLIILMERHQRVGLLQTCFIPIGRETLFCRIMQFSTRLYLMPSAMGLEFWQGKNGNYWGHNAIIRTKAFIETCGLPELPGRAPLGGRILSHDIVEAAFIGRGGWEAWLLPNLPGTYEELPTNLIDFMQRDRRWCAGNLQHQHIIRAHGIPFGNRMHMALGIMAYAAGPLWLAFIMLALVGSLLSQSDMGIHLATAGFFSPQPESKHLFMLTMGLLFGPKIAAFMLAMVRKETRKSFGGGWMLIKSALLEQVFIMLQQPAVMLFYTTFIVMPLLGSVVKWEAQPRSERGISWKEAFKRHRNHVALGVVFTGVLFLSHGVATMIGLLPILLGLYLSPAFTVITSRISVGRKARDLKLFLTVDEIAPAPELRALHKILAEPETDSSSMILVPNLPSTTPISMEAQKLRYTDEQRTRKRDVIARTFGISGYNGAARPPRK